MTRLKTIKLLALTATILCLPLACQNKPTDASKNCLPTSQEEMGPFYRPNAPNRSTVGKGYLLKGSVRSVTECRPLPGAVLEFWLVNEQGDYDAAHRATVTADRLGRYSFESNRPTDYIARQPHIHIRVSAVGHQTLTTQHYPESGNSVASFDLILSRSVN